MRYCVHCGEQIHDDAVICIKCGRSVEPRTPAVVSTSNNDDTMDTVIKVFLIIGCVFQGWMILPLAWCLPITISIFKSLRDGTPISTGMKICTLLFVNLVAGVCLLCRHDDV